MNPTSHSALWQQQPIPDAYQAYPSLNSDRTTASDIQARIVNLRETARGLVNRAASIADVLDGVTPSCDTAEGKGGLCASHSSIFEEWRDILIEIHGLHDQVGAQLDRMAGRLA